MKFYDYIIIIFSIITLLLILNINTYEFMEQNNIVLMPDVTAGPLPQQLNDTLKTKDNLTVPDIVVDPLFADIIFYQNDLVIDYPTYKKGKLGLHKCFELCDGSCVEFVMTGNCLCFPNIK